MEYLPKLEKRGETLWVTGRVERLAAHGAQPVFHGTAVVVTVLPDGRILLVDKTEKQRKKGRDVPENTRVFDIVGGHLAYDDIPEKEHDTGVSEDTFRRCAARELWEELFFESGETIDLPLQRFVPVGMYPMENNHNKEYSWVYAAALDSMGPYAAADTVEGETVPLAAQAVTWEALLALHGGETPHRLSDGIGRVLDAGDGPRLLECINAARALSAAHIAWIEGEQHEA